MKYLLPLLIVLFSACTKEKNVAIEYKAFCTNCDLSYTNTGGSTATVYVNGDWSAKVSLEEDATAKISACQRDTIDNGPNQMWIFANGSQFAEKSGRFEWPDAQCGEVTAKVPGKD